MPPSHRPYPLLGSAYQPEESARIVIRLGLRTREQRVEDGFPANNGDRSAILIGGGVHMIGRNDAARARHVANNKAWLTRQVVPHIFGHHAADSIVAASRRRSDDENHLPTGIESLRRLGPCRFRCDQNRKRHNEDGQPRAEHSFLLDQWWISRSAGGVNAETVCQRAL